MKIEKILSMSCEHQRYRRAAQIGALEIMGYSINNLEIIWGRHRDFYSDTHLINRLEEHGLHNFTELLNYPINHAMRNYSLSLLEAHIRALLFIQNHKINALILDDDILLKVSYYNLCWKLEQLESQVDEIGVVQLDYNSKDTRRKNNTNDLSIINGEFVRGTISNGSAAVFVTPYGADALIKVYQNTDKLLNLERMLPELSSKNWMFSVLSPTWVTRTVLQGKSIAALHTENEKLRTRSTDPNIVERHMKYVEHFRL